MDELTNFPDGVSSFGIPLFGSWIPPIAGTYYHVCPGSTAIINNQSNYIVGSSGNDGLSKNTALDSIATAYDKCVSGAGDGIILWSYGTSTAMCTSYLTAALDWTKWGITVVGICAPTMFSQRARIANKSTALNLGYLIDVQGSNNTFLNMSFYNGGTTGAGGVKVSGDRNFFGKVNFMGGMGMTTPTTDDYSLLIAGGDENTFERCVIGSDTFDKTNIAGAELHFSTGAMRNRFYKCEVISFRSAGTTAGAIKLVGLGDSIERDVVFEDCFFNMYRDGALTSEVSVVIGTAPNNGMLCFFNCRKKGFTDFGATASARVFIDMATTATNTGAGGALDNPS
jgi:hypothetical protein